MLSIARLWEPVAKTTGLLVCARNTAPTTTLRSSLVWTGTTSKWFATNRGKSENQFRSAFVLQAVTLATDLYDMGVMQESAEQRGEKRRFVGEGRGPLGERQVAGENRAAPFVALGHDVEEEIGLLASERQVADLINHQQTRPITARLRYSFRRPWLLAVASCSMRSAAVGTRVLIPGMAARYASATARWLLPTPGAKQHDVLGALDERQRSQFLDLGAGCAAGEREVELLQGLQFSPGEGSIEPFRR
jgi:hypothetical protein